MATETDRILRRIIDVLEDGKAFYAEAREETKEVALGQLCTRMVDERDIGIRQLLPYLTPGEAEAEAADEDGTWTGTFDRLYAEARSLFGQSTRAFVDGLVDYEARLLATLDEGLAALPPGDARNAVTMVRDEVARTRETIGALRETEERASKS